MAAVAGIVASFVGPAIELGKVIVAPIKRQFNYLCCFASNIQSLKDEAEKLDNARAGLQLRVDTAENNVEVILPEVVSWLTRANENQIIISAIEAEIPNVKKDFLSMKLRFLLTRKAKKTTEAIKKLRGECIFNLISQPAPPPATGSIQIGETYEFETRKKIVEDIMEALRGGEVNMLGICGMGGVGKTTMAKRIMKRARAEDLFDEILMVVVSQPVDMSKIQLEIAESLDLKLEVESLPARAHKLNARLMGTKRTLVVLDDVWEILKLEELGIPCESGVKGCKILLTSRNRDVFDAMNVRKDFGLQILLEEEAWFLFREKVGTCVDDMHLVSIAREVARECKGLPIALVTVGRALKDKKTKFIWEDALQQLKSSNATHVLAEVYKPLKLSYDLLDNRHAKDVFLLCSLFPEDANISLECLTWYLLGLGMFEGIRNLKETRNKVYTLVELLKSRFLLLDGDDEHHVKMHDVVRDVVIFIASQKRLVDPNFNSIDWWLEHSYSDCNWTSVFLIERLQLPIVLEVPNLRLLLIHNGPFSSEIEMHDQFFEVMEKLNVLSLTNISFKAEALQLPKNLKALNLEGCTLESVSVVGQLLNLQILRCHSCNLITELPTEIGRLIHLRLLDFSDCTSLKRVAPGILSSLVRLEELKMIGSFQEWEADKNGKERRNASLNELQYLSNLTCLEIEIADCALAAEDIRLSSKIVKYDIRFKRLCGTSFYKTFMSLKWPREISLGNWIHILLRNTEHLYLEGNGSSNLDLAQVQNMKNFYFGGCWTVKKLVNTKSIDWRFGVFPVLESLKLAELPNLEEICDGPIEAGSNCFNNLKELEISYLPALMYLWNSQSQNVSLRNLTSIKVRRCDKLRNLFPLKMAKDGFLQLKRLEISSCEMMEEVFSNDGEEGHITFPKLENLSLVDLPSLITFCKGIEGIEYPVLWEMEIDRCSKLTSFVSSTGNSSSLAGHSDECLHFFCNQKVTFGSLQILIIKRYENISNLWCHKIPPGFFSKLVGLEITDCGRIRSLFTSSIAADLVNLIGLEIWDCSEMHIMEMDPSVKTRLESLTLRSLPNLVNFSGWGCALELPSLMEVTIYDCSRMESFTMGSLTAPKLESIDIQRCDKLHNLFLLTMAKNGLLQLKSLNVTHCKSIEEVFFNANENDGKRHITFPKLEIMKLYDLPSLTTFHKGIESIEFPLLTEMDINRCPKLTGFATSSGNNSRVADQDDDSFHLLCNQKVTFGSLNELSIDGYENISNLWCHQIPPTGFFNKLEELYIRNCGRISSLFTSSIAANLVNLKKLSIIHCSEMVKVIGDEEETLSENSPIFPSLQRLFLISLPNLVIFCGRRCALQLPSLMTVCIQDCHWMESFTMGSLTTPNLEDIKIDNIENEGIEDLNGATQLWFREKHQRDQESTQIEKEQEESNKEDGKHLKVETEEEESKQARNL
ncbi:hypothetical protein BUALT_Bualt12G0033000 [Buddleja alternifolia]|uniref:AAA+ ATPase domain-containing protein n=1 Tax=Buddleja alternifolia TaxID=168488 RepID=A0AAV6WM64_9LAMI|nr:hypothetical protein BUALT_Bualt12G0033000 [Buddleja alternifolia]